MRALAALVLAAFCSCAYGGSISYEIYAIPDGIDGPRQLLHHGVRTYTAKDIVVTEHENDPERGQTESLEIAGGFRLGASVYAEDKTEGFGLWLEREPGSFSWEWFNIESTGVFKKLQGTGRLKVTFAGAPLVERPVRYEFLDDITLRMREAGCADPDKETHLMVVRKGSVFEIP